MGGGGGLGDGAEMGLGPSDEIVFVLMMMAAGVVAGDECYGGCAVGVGVDQLFDSPAKAGCVVGVDGFEDEEQRPDLEKDDGADKGGDAAAVVGLAFERCRGAYERQPSKETLDFCFSQLSSCHVMSWRERAHIDNPNYTTRGEDERHQPGNVPHRKFRQRADDACQHLLGMRRRPGGRDTALVMGASRHAQRMASLAVIARPPQKVNPIETGPALDRGTISSLARVPKQALRGIEKGNGPAGVLQQRVVVAMAGRRRRRGRAGLAVARAHGELAHGRRHC